MRSPAPSRTPHRTGALACGSRAVAPERQARIFGVRRRAEAAGPAAVVTSCDGCHGSWLVRAWITAWMAHCFWRSGDCRVGVVVVRCCCQ